MAIMVRMGALAVRGLTELAGRMVLKGRTAFVMAHKTDRLGAVAELEAMEPTVTMARTALPAAKAKLKLWMSRIRMIQLRTEKSQMGEMGARVEKEETVEKEVTAVRVETAEMVRALDTAAAVGAEGLLEMEATAGTVAAAATVEKAAS